MKHPELRCSTCGYIPDDEDIIKTNYNIKSCETCGQENVCDLCLSYYLRDIDKNNKVVGNSKCPKCNPSYKMPGKDRKLWLLDEY